MVRNQPVHVLEEAQRGGGRVYIIDHRLLEPHLVDQVLQSLYHARELDLVRQGDVVELWHGLVELQKFEGEGVGNIYARLAQPLLCRLSVPLHTYHGLLVESPCLLIHIEAVVGHIIEDLESNDEAVLALLDLEVEDGLVEDLNLVQVVQLAVLLEHQGFTLEGQAWRYFHQRVAARLVEVEVVVLEVLEDGVGVGPRARAYLHDAKLLSIGVLHLVDHEVGERVAVVGLEEL
mmetsp:Transcript_13853/g.23627  ORF Transcript_13853/g.23627 Transcript_13853/m.23627 type:complete len:233 (-) Transcript_13853:268-966(-)